MLYEITSPSNELDEYNNNINKHTSKKTYERYSCDSPTIAYFILTRI